MDTPRRAVVGLLSILTVACTEGQANLPTPAPSDGPAFHMIFLREVSCPAGMDAKICLRVKVTNQGNESGPGTCSVRSTAASDTGEEISIFGGELPLAGLAPGSDLVATVSWTRALPDPPDFVGYCEPGLRS